MKSTTIRRFTNRAIQLGAIATMLLAGCVMEDGDPYADEDVGRSQAGLYGNFDLYWPGAGSSRIDINVCWENPNNAPGSTAAARANWRDARRSAVEEAWARFARVNFYGWDGTSPVSNPRACSSGESGLHVYICDTADTACPALPASQAINLTTGISGYPGLNGTNNGIRLNRNHGLGVIVHEFGHALGFYHEEEIPNGPPAGATGGCAQQTYSNANPARYGAYDRDSIMSYCSPPTAAPWLSPNDIASIQRSYDRRISGSLVTPRGNCVAAVSASGTGATAFLWDCDEFRNDQEFWDWPSGADAKYLYMSGDSGVRCLGASSATNGADVSMRICKSNETWLFKDMHLRGFGGLCLDLRAGNTANGTPIQVWECGALGGANQRWTINNSGQIRYGATNKCATVVSNKLQIWSCGSGWTSQKFQLSNDNIRLASTGKCLDVYGPSDAQFTSGSGGPWNGSQVQHLTCNGSMNQKWNLNGAIRYSTSSSLCLDRRNTDGNGASVRLLSCSGTTNQTWDYYF